MIGFETAYIGACEAAIALQRAKYAQQRAYEQMQNVVGPCYVMGDNPKPCSYCGRKHQSSGHKSCDGCGAPK